MAQSVFDKLHELKDALDGGDAHKGPVPAGGSKGQNEVRDEIYGEAKREETIQRKEGWSERVSISTDSTRHRVLMTSGHRLKTCWKAERLAISGRKRKSG